MCHTILREVDPLNPYAALRNAEVDVLIDWLVVNEPDLVVGPVIEQRPRVLAVARFHPLATKRCVSIEDIADYEVAQFPSPPYPAALLDALVPPITPSGIPVRRTHVIRAASETISLVALGRIVHPTAASVAIFQRDDIVFVPIAGMPPLPLGLIWHKSHQDRRVRTFARFVEKFTAQTASGSAT
jgi:hypothetical protein